MGGESVAKAHKSPHLLVDDQPYFPGIDLTTVCPSIHPALVEAQRPGRSEFGFAMPHYFFRIRNGRFSGDSEYGTECVDRDAAWREMTTICADMAGSISRKLAENTEWQMELLDDTRQPVFRIRIVAESLDSA